MNLQTDIVYGPARSRRFGRSLGVNLAPVGFKACNFNCSYCQYGWTKFPNTCDWPRPADIVDAVDHALAADPDVDHITVAGNGEPTMHPAFAPIAEGLFHVRARRAPGAKLALLSNGSMLHRLDVVYSLAKFDVRSMKLDAGDATTFRLMNASGLSLGRLIANLRSVGHLTLQSMFVQDVEGVIDNTTVRAIEAWVDTIDRVRPQSVDVYTIARSTARPSLRKVPAATLEAIARRVSELGIPSRVFA